ncbi:PIN domain-containing protein, partial [Staphylococcus aureus]|nr:PIN domain-containing protein [Staphylococcus aureus]
KQPAADTVKLTRDLEAALVELKPGMPKGLEAPRVLFRQADFIEASIGNVVEALRDGAIAPLIRADCREELRRVLAYPQFARFAVDIDEALATVDRLTTAVAPPCPTQAEAIRLPRCRDGDDQKFIELAHFAGADCLVSKDKAVLKLAGRLRRSSGVAVLTPQAFAPWLAARPAR